MFSLSGQGSFLSWNKKSLNRSMKNNKLEKMSQLFAIICNSLKKVLRQVSLLPKIMVQQSPCYHRQWFSKISLLATKDNGSVSSLLATKNNGSVSSLLATKDNSSVSSILATKDNCSVRIHSNRKRLSLVTSRISLV